MTAPDPAAPPFGEYVTRRLLNPAAVEGEPRGATRDEWLAAFGNDGECCAQTWRRHERWLRQAARRHEIQPIYNGCFYVEAVALGLWRNTMLKNGVKHG